MNPPNELVVIYDVNDQLPCAGLWRTGLATGCGKAVYVSHVRLFLPNFLTLLKLQDRALLWRDLEMFGLGGGRRGADPSAAKAQNGASHVI